ncbi:MAG TPA: GTP cyclohydrolase IIa [Limnochordia bacterium]
MQFRLGIIGPPDIVAHVEQVAMEFPLLSTTGFAYETEDEAGDVVRRAEADLDAILFTGPAPYYLALEAHRPQIPWRFVSYEGSALLRTLLLLSREGHDITRLSIDTLPRSVVDEVYAGLGLASESLYTKEYQGPITSAALAAFHTELWEGGRIHLTVTCLRSAERRLVAAGVPVVRIVPTTASIRSSLRLIVSELMGAQSKASQVALGILQIDRLREFSQRHSEYEVQRTKLELHKILLDYAERHQGSVFFLGGDQFVLVTTRGNMAKATDHYRATPLLSEIRRRLPITVSIGNGVGRTAFDAERNARLALAYAHQRGGDCAYLMLDDHRLIGPLGAPEQLEYATRSVDQRWVSLAKQAGLSAATLSRVAALLGKLHKATLTTGEMAEGLGITLRSARRIMSHLAAAGLARLVGEEQPPGRGRPRHVYLLRFEPASDAEQGSRSPALSER